MNRSQPCRSPALIKGPEEPKEVSTAPPLEAPARPRPPAQNVRSRHALTLFCLVPTRCQGLWEVAALLSADPPTATAKGSLCPGDLLWDEGGAIPLRSAYQGTHRGQDVRPLSAPAPRMHLGRSTHLTDLGLEAADPPGTRLWASGSP